MFDVNGGHGLVSIQVKWFVTSNLDGQQWIVIAIFPQIAIAIGVLTSNRGGGDEPLWRIGRGTRVPLQGAVDVVPLLGAIAGCHCSVLWLGEGRVTANFGGVDVVPLLDAIAGCHCSVLWLSGRGAIAGCHCRVPLQCAMVGGGEGNGQLWRSGRGAMRIWQLQNPN